MCMYSTFVNASYKCLVLQCVACASQAEELIKQEMLAMMKNDLVHHPPVGTTVGKAALSKAKAELEASPLQSFSEEELLEVNACSIAVYTEKCQVYMFMQYASKNPV